MDSLLSQNTKKSIAFFCLLIYVMFSFLSNIGATLCFGTNQNRHIGIHALSYDSCPDGKTCSLIKSRLSFSDCKKQFDYSHFQLNLNRILSLNLNTTPHNATCMNFHYDLDLFEEKYNKITWDICKKPKISRLKELKTIILII